MLVHYHDKADKSDITRVENLIKAAKIQQQHGQFIDCNEKVHRAIDLMRISGAEKAAKQD